MEQVKFAVFEIYYYKGFWIVHIHNSDDLLFYSVHLPTVGKVTTRNFSVFYNRIKVCIVN